MRLLKQNNDGELVMEEFFFKKIPAYVILSHTWSTTHDEVEFMDFKNGTWRDMTGATKLYFCARQAQRDGYSYFWIDSCCIDQQNLPELSHAINSMFRWYKGAKRCYVYLCDVTPPSINPDWESSFRESRWFTRGWTLQELLAPEDLEFFSSENEDNENEKLGSKVGLMELVHEITGIPAQALQRNDLSQFSPRERLSWSRERNTTRQEDKAYCLLGICGITMELDYGEKEYAWNRLNDEVNKLPDNDGQQRPYWRGRTESGQNEDDWDQDNYLTRRPSRRSMKWLLYLVITVIFALLLSWTWKSPPSLARSHPALLSSATPLFTIIGRTGAGKSTFIQALGGLEITTGRPPKIGDQLEPCTQNLTFYRFNVHGTDAYIIDTPGFGDTNMSDVHVLMTVFEELNRLSLENRKIRLIYLYDISLSRFDMEAHKNLAYFELLVGVDNAESVALVTGKWRKDPTEEDTRLQLLREKGLKGKYWKAMLEVGTKYERHDGSRKSALLIIQRLLQKPVMLNREPGWVRQKLKIIEEQEEARRRADEETPKGTERHPFYSTWLQTWLLRKVMWTILRVFITGFLVFLSITSILKRLSGREESPSNWRKGVFRSLFLISLIFSTVGLICRYVYVSYLALLLFCIGSVLAVLIAFESIGTQLAFGTFEMSCTFSACIFTLALFADLYFHWPHDTSMYFL